jgi:hypothetical protein
MKPSPLQLEAPTYPVLSVRAVPDPTDRSAQASLPIGIDAHVLYDSDGIHFAFLSIKQEEDSYPYQVEIDAFTTFKIDVEGCRQAYKAAFNPPVVAVNVIRILYSGAREIFGLLTARGPHGPANLPAIMIEPGDVKLEFERGKLAQILAESFGYPPEDVERALQKLEGREVVASEEDVGRAAGAIRSDAEKNEPKQRKPRGPKRTK